MIPQLRAEANGASEVGNANFPSSGPASHQEGSQRTRPDRPQSFLYSSLERAFLSTTNLPAANAEKEANDIALLLLLKLFEVLKGSHFDCSKFSTVSLFSPSEN